MRFSFITIRTNKLRNLLFFLIKKKIWIIFLMQLLSGWFFVFVSGSRISLLFFVFCYFLVVTRTSLFVTHQFLFVVVVLFLFLLLFLHVNPNWITAHSELIYLFDIFDARVQKCIFILLLFRLSVYWVVESVCCHLCALFVLFSFNAHTHTRIQS